MKYADALKNAMTLLASHKKTIFIGQSVKYGGTGLYDSITHIADNKKIEWPVAEYLQTGVTIGMALEGYIPVSLYPRWNFLLMGTDQIINHLDKFSILSRGRCNPKVIIRVSIGSEHPVDPQDQHKGNFSEAFRMMCKTIDIIELNETSDIIPSYEKALYRTDNRSTILVENADYLKYK